MGKGTNYVQFFFNSEPFGLLSIDARGSSKVDLMLIFNKDSGVLEESELPIYELNQIKDLANYHLNMREGGVTQLFQTLESVNRDYVNWLNNKEG